MGAHFRFQLFETIPWLFRWLSPFHHAGEKPNFIMHERELETISNGHTTPASAPTGLPTRRSMTLTDVNLSPPVRSSSSNHAQPQPIVESNNLAFANGAISCQTTTAEISSDPHRHFRRSDSNRFSNDVELHNPELEGSRGDNNRRTNRPESDGLLGHTVNQLMSIRALMDEALEGLTTWQVHARYQRLPNANATDETGDRAES